VGAAYALAGRVADGLPLLEQSVEQAASMGWRADASALAARLGEAYLAAGRAEDAAELAARALHLALEHKGRGRQAWALRLLGEIAGHPDPPDAETAEKHYRQALALAGELGMRPLQAHCHLGLGTLYSNVGRREEARAKLAAAIELYQSMEMSFWLHRAEAELAKVSR
jgi:tetratricopeptide (TPR) repeat protein